MYGIKDREDIKYYKYVCLYTFKCLVSDMCNGWHMSRVLDLCLLRANLYNLSSLKKSMLLKTSLCEYL